MHVRDLNQALAFEEILRRAIAEEDESSAFYQLAAERASTPRERQIFLALAADEVEHRRRLEDILTDREMRDDLNHALGG